ncbi:T9SS type A sorting domain-containing protein [bacterium]|nr:T9SS type A sorting domain-containing protein [bacterium]
MKKLTLLFYWLFFSTFLCFAQTPTVGLIKKSSSVLDAYTLITPFSSNHVYLIDNCGLEVKHWESEYKGLISYLLPNGDLLRAGLDPNVAFGNAGYHGILQIFDWEGDLTWEYKLSSDSFILHHDIEPMPNGNILAIGWHKLQRPEIIALGRDSTDDLLVMELWEEVILEIKPIGSDEAEIVWEWHVRDHVVQGFNPSLSNYADPADHPELLDINYAKMGLGGPGDWLHFNSVSYNSSLDQILLSCLTFNEIYIIDHSTSAGQTGGHIGGNSNKGGDILFRWGNPEAYGHGTAANKQLFGQHDPKWVKTGSYRDQIMIFNNGGSRGYSSIDIINPTILLNAYQRASDGTYEPAAPSNSLTVGSGFYSAVMSGASLMNQTRLITCEATKGRIMEYDISTGLTHWEYINPVKANGVTEQGDAPGSNSVFKAFRYNSTYSAFDNKTLTTGAPLEANPYNSDCWFVETEDSTSDDTTSQDTVVETTYVLESQKNNAIKVYPNPSATVYHVDLNLHASVLRVMDQQGKVIYELLEPANKIVVDASGYSPGMYFLEIISPEGIQRVRLLKN